MKNLILVFFSLFFSLGISSNTVPIKYQLDKNFDNAKILSSGLKSNGISEIVLQGDSIVWLGTGMGLSFLEDSITINTMDTLTLKNDSTYLMEDGVSGIAIYDSHIIFAGASGDNLGDFGTGIFYNDGTALDEWIHHPQPIEFTVEPYITQEIGSGYFKMLPITTHYNNISYDLAITDKYAWITSWAGGLRRIHVDSLVNPNARWSPIPLPEDGQLYLNTCDEDIFDDSLNIITDFFLNPRDPINGGNHNHKAFSVIAYSDTIWVGTANGINRGVLGERGCINWSHYSYQYNNILGNFVVSISYQNWNNNRIIWAATLNADSYGEQRGVSYTLDQGATWQTTLIGERVYNISSEDSLIFVSTENGLWKTIIRNPRDPILWAKFEPFIEQAELYNKEILTNEVYTAVADHREYFLLPTIWIGTPDGLARLKGGGAINWDIYQVEANESKVYAYPNPFSPTVDNVINGNGYVRFSIGDRAFNSADISIYNFAMEEVLSFNYSSSISMELKWDGRDSNGYLVSNGVYFVNLKLNNSLNASIEEYWTKVLLVK